MMQNGIGGLGGLGGLPLSDADKALMLHLLQAWQAQQQATPDPNAPSSDKNFQSFFEQDKNGKVTGLNRFIQSLGNYQFNMPSFSETQNTYRMPEYDSLIDPNWINMQSTSKSY